MVDLELAYMAAAEIARRIRAKELSPVEAVENSLARIEEMNAALNCFCFTYPEEAIDKARAAERAVMSGAPMGPLHGIPIAIKDFTPTRGKTTTLGSRVFEHWVPEHDSVIVERLAAAGAIMVGKTTTPEFASGGFTRSPLWGVTCNPWNAERTPGGSSGGAAAAVAAGCVPLAEGSDFGGSVREPAACCGIVGLKPSLGRIPCDLQETRFDTTNHFGPLARGVADAALFLDAAQGSDTRDIQSFLPRLEVPNPPQADVEGLKLALNVDYGHFFVAPEVAANTRAAADALAECGARVETVEIAWDRSVVAFAEDHSNARVAYAFGDYLEEWRDRMSPRVVAMIEAGRRVTAADLIRFEVARTRHWEAYWSALAGHDALLCPTQAGPAPRNDQSEADFDWEDEDGRYHGHFMAQHFSFISQCPAISVPSGFTGDGLPTGLQIVGRPYDDLGVLNIAAAFEQARPWAHRRPPV